MFKKAFKTLAELMTYMNQHLLFPLVTKKYKTANLENTVKLLYRSKNLLEARKLGFKVLQNILEFEKITAQIRNDVDAFLDTVASSYNAK